MITTNDTSKVTEAEIKEAMKKRIYWAGELYDTDTIDEKPIKRTIKVTNTINDTDPRVKPLSYDTTFYCGVEKVREDVYKLTYYYHEGSICPDCINRIYPKDAKIMLGIDDAEVEKLHHTKRASFNRPYIQRETFLEAFQAKSEEAGATKARYIESDVKQNYVELIITFESFY